MYFDSMDALNEDSKKDLRNVFTAYLPTDIPVIDSYLKSVLPEDEFLTHQIRSYRTDKYLKEVERIFIASKANELDRWCVFACNSAELNGYAELVPIIKKLSEKIYNNHFLPLKEPIFLPFENPIAQPNKEQTIPVSKIERGGIAVWNFINANIISTILGGAILAWLTWIVTKK